MSDTNLMRIEDVAACLKISKRTAWRFHAHRRFGAPVRAGRRVIRFRPQSVEKLLSSK